jgi:hypothetical protein
MKKPSFFMSAYLIDAICSVYIFLLLDGIGTLSNHLYMSIVQNYGMSIIRNTYMTSVIIS